MAVHERPGQAAPPRLKREIGTIGLLFTAVGSIIGSGWLFGALNAAEKAGPASIFSWLIGLVMFALIGLTFAELGTMFPHSGGVARYPHYSHGTFASFSTGWITWLAAVSVPPIETEAAIQYATNHFHWLETTKNGVPVLTGGGLVVAVLLMAVFVGINFFGVRWFARLNNVLVWWKLAIIVLVVIAFLVTAFDPSHFNLPKAGGFAPYGANGVFSAVATAGIAFAFFGFRQGVELAGETDNPRRNVPLTVVGSIVLCGVIYVALQIAFIGAAPTSAITKGGWEKVGDNFSSATDTLAQFGPLAAIATIIGLSWMSYLLYVDAVISPSDTGLIYMGVTARLSYAIGRNGTAPKGLTKVTTRGVPWVSLVLAFVVGCLFFLPFPGWQSLVGFVTSATVLSFGAGPVVMLCMRRQLPDRNRPFRLPAAWVVAFLALWSANLIIYWTGWQQDRLLFLGVVLGFVLMFVFRAVHKDRSSLNFRNGWWLLVWYVGLALISFLGSFGSAEDPTTPATSFIGIPGNLGVIGFAGAFVWTFLLAALVFFLALRQRLPREEVEAILDRTADDDPEEELQAAH